MTIIGLFGALIAYCSGIMTGSVAFYKMGIGSNVIQAIGLIAIYMDRD